METLIHQVMAGYQMGHYVQAHSLAIDAGTRSTLREVERLSDLSGYTPPEAPLTPGGYLTLYPAWSWYVIQRTWPDPTSGRPGCVLSHALLVPIDTARDRSMAALCALHRRPETARETGPYKQPLTVDVPEQRAPVFPAPEHLAKAEALSKYWHANSSGSVLYPNGASPPDDLLIDAWTYQQPEDRLTFAACTFALSVRRTPRGAPFNLLMGPAGARPELRRVACTTLDRIF